MRSIGIWEKKGGDLAMTTALGIKMKVGGATTSLLDLFFPVGSVYESTKSTNPSTFMGGVWVQMKDKFLLGAGARAAGATGGADSHTLSLDEMPSHNHTWLVGGNVQSVVNVTGSPGSYAGALALASGQAISIGKSGGGNRTTTCLRIKSFTCGSVLHSLLAGGAEWLTCLFSNGATERPCSSFARSRSEEFTSALSIALRRRFGSALHGSESRPAPSSHHPEGKRRVIMQSEPLEGPISSRSRSRRYLRTRMLFRLPSINIAAGLPLPPVRRISRSTMASCTTMAEGAVRMKIVLRTFRLICGDAQPDRVCGGGR